ncbi:hypothetical protein IT413_05075 [Candidatus Peregrinibacteria bacterium]|nr:hypothetical protein [Candidatus Peregrinibacteria bacterium]
MSLDNFKSSVVRPSSSKSRKLAAALGLILGSTAVSVSEMGCGLDVQGTADITGAGGEGGTGNEGGTDAGVNSDAIFPVEDANMDTGDFPDAKEDADAGTMDADTKDAEAGMDASSDADADVMDADAGLDASADADADVTDAAIDADAGCVDIPVTFKNMTEYVLRVYSGSCSPAAVTYSSLGSFTGAETTLCLKTGDIALLQVHDGADGNAVEFDTTGLPLAVKKVSFGVTTPISEAEANAYCPDSAGWSTLNVASDDVNPAANSYKYLGGSPKSNGYKIVF